MARSNTKQSRRWQGWQLGFIVGLFLLSRWYILAHPPYYKALVNGKEEAVGYSDVKQDSERYANMWKYGLTPYRKMLYEYPPAPIPLIKLALEIDLAGVGYFYLNYRVLIFLFESILFTGLIYTVIRLPITFKQQWAALLFFIGAGALAKDYWYEGLDLWFFGTLSLGLIWRLWHNYRLFHHRIIFWALFWWSVAIKLLTVPLLIPFGFIKRRSWRKELIAIGIGFAVIWAIPVALYRSSLVVFLVFHGERPLKYGSFGTFLIKLINDFTKTETISTMAPHFPWIGPVSTVMEQVFAFIFPFSIVLVLGWSIMILNKRRLSEPDNNLTVFHYLIKIAWVYMFTIFMTSKIFSSPFHIWYVPLIALYPFKNWRWQAGYIALALIMLTLDTTPYFKVPAIWFGLTVMERARDLLRFMPMMILLVMSIKLPEPKVRRVDW